MLLTAGLSAAGKYIAPYLPEATLQAAGFLASFAVISVLFAMMFKWLPDTPIAWRDVWLGAILTAAPVRGGKIPDRTLHRQARSRIDLRRCGVDRDRADLGLLHCPACAHGRGIYQCLCLPLGLEARAGGARAAPNQTRGSAAGPRRVMTRERTASRRLPSARPLKTEGAMSRRSSKPLLHFFRLHFWRQPQLLRSLLPFRRQPPRASFAAVRSAPVRSRLRLLELRDVHVVRHGAPPECREDNAA